MTRRRSCFPVLLIIFILVIIAGGTAAFLGNRLAWQNFGAPASSLDPWQRFSYSLDLAWNAADLTQPRDPAGSGQEFTIQPGESPASISQRLEEAGLIRNAHVFTVYLIWSGTDTIIQTGMFRFSPAQTGRAIADSLRSTTLTEITFAVLPGWRMEEVAASLTTSGLEITPEEFLSAAAFPVNPPDYLPVGASAEGFLYPGRYTLPRTTTAEQLVNTLLQGFSSALSPDMQSAFNDHGLTVYQAVILASIIQREAVHSSEMPMIASVFYNRLAAGMPLQTDPTVQYAIGFNNSQATWWTSPLSLQDLKVDSPYNTYLFPGLPPGPISNPGIDALQAVAAPAQSNYFYFQARCDGSGLHNFAETLDQHNKNNCP